MAEDFSFLNPSGTAQVQPQQAPGMAGVMQPQDPLQAELTKPATSQEEVQDRFVKFKQLFADPKFQQSLLMFGSQVLKQGGQGDSTGQAIGGGLQTGMGTYNLLQQQEHQTGAIDAETQRRAAATASEGAQRTATTEDIRYKTDEAKRTQGDRDKARSSELAKMTKELDKMDVDLASGNLKNAGQKTLNDINAYKLFLTEQFGQGEAIATLDQARAQTQRSQAEARIKNLEARIVEGMSEEEQKSYVKGGRGGGTAIAAVETQKQLESIIKRAYPEMDDQQIAKEVLRMQSSRKEGRTDELKLIETLQFSTDPKMREQANVRLKMLMGGGGDTARPQIGGTGRNVSPQSSPSSDPAIGYTKKVGERTWKWVGRDKTSTGWELVTPAGGTGR